MSILKEYKHEDRGLYAWIRDVRRVLTAREEGIRWADNIGPTPTLRYNSDGVPYDVPADMKSRPLAVVCLAATQHEDQSQTESFARVTWSFVGGRVRIEAIQVVNASVDYDVTLGILMG